MKAGGMFALFLAGSLVAGADDDTATMTEMLQGAQQWAQENLDTNVLHAFPEMDERAVQQFFREVQQCFQPEPSATASARYLKYLHNRFKDWRLALAAYNAGEGTVQKLLDRYKTSSYDAIAEHLPAETQMYVPRVEAILLRREGAKLEQLSVPQG